MIGEPCGLIEMICWYAWSRATRDLWDEAFELMMWPAGWIDWLIVLGGVLFFLVAVVVVVFILFAMADPEVAARILDDLRRDKRP